MPNNGSQLPLEEVTGVGSRLHVTHDDEETIVELEMRKTGYTNAARALEPVARVDEDIAEEFERMNARIAKVSKEIEEMEKNSFKKLEKARYDSNGIKFKQGDTILMVPNHGTNWRSNHLQSKQVTISKQTSHKLELSIKDRTAQLFVDPNRSYEPAYLVIYQNEDGTVDAYQVDNLFVLSARSSDGAEETE